MTAPKETECCELGGATPLPQCSGLGSRALGSPATQGPPSFRAGGSWGQVQAGMWGPSVLGGGGGGFWHVYMV